MPYIKPADRDRLIPPEGMVGDIPKTTGELNYLVSMAIKKFITEKGKEKLEAKGIAYTDAEAFEAGKSYGLFNDITIDLEDAKEAIRRFIRVDEFVGEIADIAYKYILQTDKVDIDITARGEDEVDEVAKRTNSARGAIECAKIEFHRRIVAPYEDKKIKENGDVY